MASGSCWALEGRKKIRLKLAAAVRFYAALPGLGTSRRSPRWWPILPLLVGQNTSPSMLPLSHPLRSGLLRGSNGHAAGGTFLP